MAVWIKVGLKNETRSGLAEMRQDFAATAQASASLFNTTDADALRQAIQGVTTELRDLSTTMQQNRGAAQSVRDHAHATTELKHASQQTIVVNQAQSTSLGDVAMAGLNAYLRFRMLNTAIQGGKYLWKEHREATVAGGTALGGVAVAAGAAYGGLLLLQAGFGAVQAVAQSVSNTIEFMREHGINNIRELTEASDNLAAAWTNLKRSALESDAIKRLTATAAESLNDTAGTIRIVQELVVELKKGLDLKDIAGSWDRFKDAEGWKPLGQSLHAIGEDTIGWLSTVSLHAKGLQGLLNLTGIKADRTPIKQANERTLGDAQQADMKKWLKDFDKRSADAAVENDRTKYASISQVNVAIEQQRKQLLLLADGSDGSKTRIAAAQKELNETLKERARIVSELGMSEERIRQLERRTADESIKAWAAERTSIDDVRKSQSELVAELREQQRVRKLDKDKLEEYAQRFQALEQRRLQIIQDRTKAEQEYQRTLEAVAKINAEFMKEKSDSIQKAAEQVTQELRAAIAEARGVLNPQASLTDELQQQFGARDVARQLIAERQRQARDKHIAGNRDRVDLEGKAWGDTAQERNANQRAFDRELAKINAQIKRDTLRQITAGGRGKVPSIDEAEVRAIRQQMLMDRADKAVESNRMTWATRDQLKAQLEADHAGWQRQRAQANAVHQVKGLLGPQPGQPGFNPTQPWGTNPAEQAMSQGFGEFGNLARSQMQWGQQVTQTADAARADAAKATALFDQLVRQMSANGTRLRAIQGTLR